MLFLFHFGFLFHISAKLIPQLHLPPLLLMLNGASSSGKTTLLRAIQNGIDLPFVEMGIDKFLWMLPSRYLKTPAYWQQIFFYHYEPDSPSLIDHIETGILGHKLIYGMHRAAQAMLLSGNYVLIDHVLLEPAWVLDCSRLFQHLNAYLIKVHCPLEVMEAREKQRSDRTIGQAKAQYNSIHAHAIYDFEIDTALLTPEKASAAIYDYLSSGTQPSAFRQLFTKLSA